MDIHAVEVVVSLKVREMVCFEASLVLLPVKKKKESCDFILLFWMIVILPSPPQKKTGWECFCSDSLLWRWLCFYTTVPLPNPHMLSVGKNPHPDTQ